MQWTEIIIVELQKFLDKFWAKPPDSFGASGLPWSLDQIIRAEATHWLLGAVSGWFLFCLIWTIFSSKYSKEYDRYIWRFSFVFSCLSSVFIHITLDAYTNLC